MGCVIISILFAFWQFVSVSDSWGGAFSQCWCVDVVAGESAADCASSHQQISAHVSLQMSHDLRSWDLCKILSKQTAPWLYIPQVQHDLSFVWGSSGRNEIQKTKNKCYSKVRHSLSEKAKGDCCPAGLHFSQVLRLTRNWVREPD